MTDKTQFPVFTAGTLPSAPSMNGMTVLVEASDGTRSRRYSNGVVWTDDLTAAQVEATQALASKDGTGASIAAFGPTLFVAADSIIAQSLNPPNAGFLCTTTKGSHVNSGGVNVQGVTNIYSETPLRLKFRASHGLVTGDEVMFWPSASGMAVTSLNLAYHRLRVTVTAADEVTLDGTVAADCPAGLTSASAAGDALFIVDMAYGNYGFLSWALHELGHPFSRIDYFFRPGARSDQLAVAVPAELTRTYTHGLLHIGRNDGATDYSTSLATLRDLLLAKCGLITVVLPFPDGNATLATAQGMARISAFWYAQQATYPNIRVCDLWGAFSDPTLSNEASDAGWIGPDNVHPKAAGGAVGGAKLAPSLFEPINPIRRALARVGANGSNLLTGGRFTAAGGTAGAGVTGTVATSFTVGDRSNTNVTAYTQVCRTPALKRRHSTAYVAGEILDIGDGYWYAVKTAGTTAATLPEAAYQGFLTGSATYNPASLADGVGVMTTVTVAGAVLGDYVNGVSFSLDLQGVTLTAWVSAANTVSVRFQNESGGIIDLASGTLSAQVKRAASIMYDSATGVTDGTAVVFRVPQFLDKRDPSYMDIVRWQYIDQSISSDTSNDYVNFFQSVALPGSVVEGDYIRAEAVLVVADGHLKYHTVRARCINGAAAQIACSHGLGPNGLPTRSPALEMRPRLIQTPPIRVPNGTATLEFRFAMACGIEGARVLVALPMLEEVAAS